MKLRMYAIFTLVFITTVCMLGSCSQEELSEPQAQTRNEGMTRAMSDIFNVEEVYFPEKVYNWFKDLRGVDRDGNYYVVLYNPDYGKYFIYKYDLVMGTFAIFVPFEDYGSNSTLVFCNRFCFDENNNLCYLIHNPNDGKYGVRRVRADGNATAEQWFDHIVSPTSMVADINGNLFILDSFVKNGMSFMKIFKLNTNGVLSEVGVDLSGVDGTTPSLYKANGAVIYLSSDSWVGRLWYKLNTNTGFIEEVEHWGKLNWTGETQFTSSYDMANLYTLRNDNCVVQLRPNAASGLVIGVIPSSYKNADGLFVKVEVLPTRPPELFMNTDATIFYTLSNNGFYKLTLP